MAKTNFDEFRGKDCVFVADSIRENAENEGSTHASCVPYLKVSKNGKYIFFDKRVS